jgi:hypothetical protein
MGNIIPFLRDELALSYREVSLHPAALAAGLIVCGLFGERAVAWCCRRGALVLGFGGAYGGAVLLTLAHTATASIAGSGLPACCSWPRHRSGPFRARVPPPLLRLRNAKPRFLMKPWILTVVQHTPLNAARRPEIVKHRQDLELMDELRLQASSPCTTSPRVFVNSFG